MLTCQREGDKDLWTKWPVDGGDGYPAGRAQNTSGQTIWVEGDAGASGIEAA